jgi:2-polyprenyl-3-methyl-5-hydroxy-6-metoxy-1,4-benzoquinol methylase
MEKINYRIYDEFEEGFWYIQTRRDLLERVLKKYISKKKISILDLGCGTGFNYEVLKRFGHVTSLDYYEEPLQSCKKKGIPNLVKGDAQNLKFKKGSFDVIVAIEVLEHLPNDIRALKNIDNVLKKNGIFIFTTPAHPFLWSTDDVISKHKRRYSKKELKTKISKNFNIKYIGQRYFFLFLPTVIIFYYQKIMRRVFNKRINSLTMTPKFINNMLILIMNFENYLISKGIVFPVGIGWIGALEKKDLNGTKKTR